MVDKIFIAPGFSFYNLSSIAFKSYVLKESTGHSNMKMMNFNYYNETSNADIHTLIA